MRYACIVGLVVGGAVLCAASNVDSAYVLKLTDQDKCIGVTGKDANTATIGDCTGDDAQLWEWTGTSKKQYKNMLTGTCLTIDQFTTVETVGVKLEECKTRNNNQRFLPPDQPFINSLVDACVGPCSDGSSDVCAFKDGAGGWCETCGGLTTYNKKVSVELYCSLPKAQGSWTFVNATECSKTCDCGMLKVTYECKPGAGGYQNACCSPDTKPPTTKLCNPVPCDATLKNFYVIKSADGTKCMQSDGKNLGLGDCNGGDSQLWFRTANYQWVDKVNQLCLNVPATYKCGETNPAILGFCEEKKTSRGAELQVFDDADIINVQGVHVCIGPSADGKPAAFRDTDADVKDWCAAGSKARDGKDFNKKMATAVYCEQPGTEEQCAGKPSKPTNATTAPATPTTSSSSSSASESTTTTTTAEPTTTPAQEPTLSTPGPTQGTAAAPTDQPIETSPAEPIPSDTASIVLPTDASTDSIPSPADSPTQEPAFSQNPTDVIVDSSGNPLLTDVTLDTTETGFPVDTGLLVSDAASSVGVSSSDPFAVPTAASGSNSVLFTLTKRNDPAATQTSAHAKAVATATPKPTKK
eukprot:comp23644_c0_seq1/m.40347 comp23644_c0_seq1/g.40347  ORF comp23644_c0_seq1/g.40347 comp23644_c0_seq1/m.40347 type:complete len:582 (-) comp23644_c0_seq1:480-2225(-)